jgi:hypothetical protein
MFEFLGDKLRQVEGCSALFVRRSSEEICEKEEVLGAEEILELLQRLMNTSGSELKRSERLASSSKKAEKPRISYLSIKIDDFVL